VARTRIAKHREENETEFSRIVAFSDGVFAIAITLLVLQLEVPEHFQHDDLTQALLEQWQDVFAYALSFAVIGRFWVIHHRFFGDVTGFDAQLIALNLFYLAWIVLIPFSSEVLGDHGGEKAAVILYSINLAGVVLSGVWLFADAQRVGLTREEPEVARENRGRALRIAAVFVLSIPVALVNPRLAQWLWLALFLSPLAERLSARRRAAG
jgi:TMEM175 potassium channel family protein